MVVIVDKHRATHSSSKKSTDTPASQENADATPGDLASGTPTAANADTETDADTKTDANTETKASEAIAITPDAQPIDLEQAHFKVINGKFVVNTFKYLSEESSEQEEVFAQYEKMQTTTKNYLRVFPGSWYIAPNCHNRKLLEPKLLDSEEVK